MTRSILTELGPAPFWSLSVLIGTTSDFTLIRTASYIAYQYPRKLLLIPQRHISFSRICLHGNIFHSLIPRNVFRNELVS
jgi:hypothetical protein